MTLEVHKQLLVLNSPYFEKAPNGPFPEASKQEVVIDNMSDTRRGRSAGLGRAVDILAWACWHK